MKLFLESERVRNFKNIAHDYYETIEKGHGWVETRCYWITEKISWLNNREQWRGLKTIGLVESERYLNGETSLERRCFINSIKTDAKQLATAVRQHWCIENNLHWQLVIKLAMICIDHGLHENNLATRMIMQVH